MIPYPYDLVGNFLALGMLIGVPTWGFFRWYFPARDDE